jgi:hypothetical protein
MKTRLNKEEKMTLSKKVIKEITALIGNVISLNNIEEFEEHEKICNTPPELWNNNEKAICDYQGRITIDLINGLEKIFKTKFYEREGN